MKKVSPKIVSLAMLIISILVAGGLGIRTAIAPPGGGASEELDPTGG